MRAVVDRRVRPGQRGTPWTQAEVDYLVEKRVEGQTLPQIAEALGRTQSSVEGRWLDERKARGLPFIRGFRVDDAAARFWARVDQSGGPDACWPWRAALSGPNSYGAVTFNMGDGRKNYGAHRVAFFLHNGRPQRRGLYVLHSCDNKACCNPAHLSEGTHSQNMREAYERRRLVASPKIGADHPRALLTETQVAAIRRLRDGGAKIGDLADVTGVAASTIENICARRSWRHIP